MTSTSPLGDPTIIPDPYPTYELLARREPVHWCDALDAWALLRHADCKAVLSDRRFVAERMGVVLGHKFPGDALPPDSIYHRFTKNVMMYTDPPLHDGLRRATRPAFTREAHEMYSALIHRVAYDLVASVPRGVREVDAVASLALELPVRAAVAAFGLPEEDLDHVLPRVATVMTFWSGPGSQPLPLATLLQALEELHEYSFELVQGRRGRVPSNTVIARLAAHRPDEADCSASQIIHQLVLLLIALFAPTTPGSASSGMLAFATHPAQVERFQAEPTCAANVANEVVRFNASNQFTWRVARQSVEIGGVRVQEGQTVVPFLGAANRDPAVFERPHEFDLSRRNSGEHLAFGFGLHSCLGRQIASLELRWFFTALLRRFERLALAGEPVWNTNLEFRSLQSLPLRLS